MVPMTSTLTPDHWMRQIFSSKAACDGGVVRRKRRDIERLIGMDRFLAEIERRGYHAVENAGQVIVFCNQEPIRLIR
jgi:hypothetical protein